MCQKQTDVQTAPRLRIISGPGELDAVYSLVRGYGVTFHVVVDELDSVYGREPEWRIWGFIITGLWGLGDREGFGFVAQVNTGGWRTIDRFDEYPVPEFITGEYSLRGRSGWLTPCSAEAKVTVCDDETVATS